MATKSEIQLRVDIIERVLDGRMSVSNAQKLLCKSKRTIYRYTKECKSRGIQFATHKNTYNSPVNKTPLEVKKRIQRLMEDKYYDFNLTHLREKLELNEGICVERETLRKWAHEKTFSEKS